MKQNEEYEREKARITDYIFENIEMINKQKFKDI